MPASGLRSTGKRRVPGVTGDVLPSYAMRLGSYGWYAKVYVVAGVAELMGVERAAVDLQPDERWHAPADAPQYTAPPDVCASERLVSRRCAWKSRAPLRTRAS